MSRASGSTAPRKRFHWQVGYWWPWSRTSRGISFGVSGHRIQRGVWAFNLSLGLARVHLTFTSRSAP